MGAPAAQQGPQHRPAQWLLPAAAAKRRGIKGLQGLVTLTLPVKASLAAARPRASASSRAAQTAKWTQQHLGSGQAAQCLSVLLQDNAAAPSALP